MILSARNNLEWLNLIKLALFGKTQSLITKVCVSILMASFALKARAYISWVKLNNFILGMAHVDHVKHSRCVNYFLFFIFCWIRIFSITSHYHISISSYFFLSQSVFIGCSYISINHASTLLLPRYLPRLCFSNSNKYIWHLNTVHLSDQCWLIHFSDTLLVT